MKINMGNNFLYILTVIAFLVLASSVGALAQEEKWTKGKIRTDTSTLCSTAFQEGVIEVTKTACEECSKVIQNKAYSYDKNELLYSLGDKNCDPIEGVHKEKEYSGWSFYVDQDLLTFDSTTKLNDDRNYTMGIGISESGSKYSEGLLANGRGKVDGFFSLHDDSKPLEIIHSADYGVTAFTPNDLEIKVPIKGDRPYASLLYYSNSKITAYNKKYAIKSKLVLGILGLDVAKSVQRYLHNDVGVSSQDPLGWDNQISEGGELTALYSVERITLWKRDTHNVRNWDISYTVGGNVGYYTDVSFGADLRLGRIVSPYYAHNANPMSNYNHALCVTCDGRDNFLFASYRARVVAYNVMLQGQFRESELIFTGSDVERLLHEASAGWTYQIKRGWQITYALNYKSKEYDGPEERDHWFGGIYISHNASD